MNIIYTNKNSLDDSSTLIPNHHHYYFPRISTLGLLMDQSEEKQYAATLRIYNKTIKQKKIHVGKIFISSWTTHKRYLRWLSVISLLKSDIKKKQKKKYHGGVGTLVLYANYLLLVNNFFFSFHFICIFLYIFYMVVLLKFFYINFFIDLIYRHASIELLQCVRMVQ